MLLLENLRMAGAGRCFSVRYAFSSLPERREVHCEEAGPPGARDGPRAGRDFPPHYKNRVYRMLPLEVHARRFPRDYTPQVLLIPSGFRRCRKIPDGTGPGGPRIWIDGDGQHSRGWLSERKYRRFAGNIPASGITSTTQGRN